MTGLLKWRNGSNSLLLDNLQVGTKAVLDPHNAVNCCPFLAWAATALEFSFGLALLLGIWLRWAALGSSVLLLLFATAMAISFGIKSPLDYSVFSASAGAIVLALREFRQPELQNARWRDRMNYACGMSSIQNGAQTYKGAAVMLVQD